VRKRDRNLSLVIALIFALTFLVPSFGMPATALAQPSVYSDYSDDGDLDVITDDADDVEDDEATLYAYVEVDEADYDADI